MGPIQHSRQRDLSGILPVKNGQRIARRDADGRDRAYAVGPDRRRHRLAGCGGLSGVGRIAARHGAIHRRGWRRLKHMTMNNPAAGLRQTPAQHSFDTQRLNAWMQTHIAGFSGPIEVQQFAGGQSNPTFLVQSPTRRYVLRRKPPGKLLPSAHAVDREFRVISALHARGFPVAAPLLYCDDAGIAGTPFYLMDNVEGRVVWEPHMPDAQPHERTAIYDAMNATLARLHSFDPTALGLGDFGRGDNDVARQVERWSKQYRASEPDGIAEMERLIAW